MTGCLPKKKLHKANLYRDKNAKNLAKPLCDFCCKTTQTCCWESPKLNSLHYIDIMKTY